MYLGEANDIKRLIKLTITYRKTKDDLKKNYILGTPEGKADRISDEASAANRQTRNALFYAKSMFLNSDLIFKDAETAQKADFIGYLSGK